MTGERNRVRKGSPQWGSGAALAVFALALAAIIDEVALQIDGLAIKPENLGACAASEMPPKRG